MRIGYRVNIVVENVYLFKNIIYLCIYLYAYIWFVCTYLRIHLKTYFNLKMKGLVEKKDF